MQGACRTQVLGKRAGRCRRAGHGRSSGSRGAAGARGIAGARGSVGSQDERHGAGRGGARPWARPGRACA